MSRPEHLPGVMERIMIAAEVYQSRLGRTPTHAILGKVTVVRVE